MKREAEAQKKRIDGLDATMKAILEKLTTMEGTARSAKAAKEGMMPTVVEGTSGGARKEELLDNSDDITTKTGTDAQGDDG